MKQILGMLHRLFRDEEGASVVEYAVLIALIIAAAVVIITVLGGKIRDGLENFNATFNG